MFLYEVYLQSATFSAFSVEVLERHAPIITFYIFTHFQTFEKKMQIVYKIVFVVYFK